MVKCAKCGVLNCLKEKKDKENPPFCPMDKYQKIYEKSLEEYKDPEIGKMAKIAALVEAEGYCEWPRLKEVIEFAKRLNYTKLGIAFCLGLRREVRKISDILKKQGFEVCSVCCKGGSIPKEILGIEEDQKVRPNTFEPMCNPVAQAMILNEEKTDLNILVGLCVGHDSLFIKYSKAPVTVLAAKDRALAHNPLGAIYAEFYFRNKLKTNLGDRNHDS